ncbi:hypothetical protein MTR67_030663 [Solanum verrucosum]|uniref:Uncharacterized protein n=1 Tax=Solanum verrucosum TaxID=315347 RepID=A0AAF0RAV3_SOLVR|nr:hypothetical protein MTR67_030663 [Solanum verrucosum]
MWIAFNAKVTFRVGSGLKASFWNEICYGRKEEDNKEMEHEGPLFIMKVVNPSQCDTGAGAGAGAGRIRSIRFGHFDQSREKIWGKSDQFRRSLQRG